MEHAKNYLSRVADALVNHLEKMKAKVQESKNIPEDRATKITAEIDAQIAETNSIKADANAATTKLLQCTKTVQKKDVLAFACLQKQH